MRDQPALSAFFIPSFAGGGAEKVMVQIAGHLAQRGHRIHLLVADTKGPYRQLVHRDIEIVDLRQASVVRCIPGLIKYVRKNKPAAMVATMLHANLALAIASLLFPSATRLIAREALPLSVEMQQSLSISVLTRLLYRRFDACISLTRCQQRDRHAVLRQSHTEKDWVIPNPLDINQLQVQSELTPSLGLPSSFNGKPVLLACGRLSRQKGFDVLLQAFAEVRTSIDCVLMILGEGEQRDSLEQLARKLDVDTHLWMPGFIENPHPYIRYCSVFVLSSWNEGMPNALLQAYSLGKKCVATDCPCGPAEIFLHPGMNRLVEPGSDSQLAEAIIAMLKAPEPEQSPEHWSDHYGIDTVCDQFCKAMNISLP